MQQTQFLQVIDRDEAERRLRAALAWTVFPAELVPLAQAGQRVVAAEVVAAVDVPGFDRSNVDGFAVQAADTFGASEHTPITLAVAAPIAMGVRSVPMLHPGQAAPIATGGMVPRGADAVVMVEHTASTSVGVALQRPITPGGNVTFAGADVSRGEVVVRRGTVVTAHEIGILAAVGRAQVPVIRRPRVAILSIGDELVPVGAPIMPGQVYDSNGPLLAATVAELHAEPIALGLVPDDEAKLAERLHAALATADLVLLSGGTSKGTGDVAYRVVGRLADVLAHGVALKPGKPLCLAVARRPDRNVPIAVLPGFPTSALFTFHEFLAPLLRAWTGQPLTVPAQVNAELPQRLNSEPGRTEFALVSLNATPTGDWSALPLGAGSGSVTAFARADGFLTIPKQREYLEAGARVAVQLFAARPLADLLIVGSHCLGLEVLIDFVYQRGFRCKCLAVGSQGGLEAAQRGACDVAGVHLWHAPTQTYNAPFVPAGVTLVRGYVRVQGLVHRPDDARFAGKTVADAVATAVADPGCVLANRNPGSGTRALVEQLLHGARPPGYRSAARSHQAVVAAIAQGRADWGVAAVPVAQLVGLPSIPITPERYDFLVPTARQDRPAVQAWLAALHDPAVRATLTARGYSA
jgi:putative molybdopterin biosynthesis protein